jgi:hypothetical protein|tara:strand:+ start:81 stop:440 length:360 start_codon:yes stop_codon:yes gene_type:complete
MKLHELISSEYVKEAPTWPVKGYSSPGNPHIDKHMDTEYGSKRKTNTNRLPSAANLNLDLDSDKSNSSSDFTQQNALDILKSVVKKAQGKKPLITTKSGTDVTVDAFGSDKSINFKKSF